MITHEFVPLYYIQQLFHRTFARHMFIIVVAVSRLNVVLETDAFLCVAFAYYAYTANP